MKIAKVVATCFLPRKVIEKTQLTGSPLGYFAHSQKFENTREIINLINFIIGKEEEYDPGIDRDLIIVNSNVDNVEGNNFLNNLNNHKISRGKILIVNRKNFGRSYGSYNEAFKLYKNDYDYFLFTEDDVIILGNNNLKIGVEKLQNYNDFGFLSYIHSTKIGKWYWSKLHLNKKNAFSCHGGTGLVSTKMLNMIYEKYGALPHNKGSNYDDDITFGEVAFPNSVIKLGYKIHDLPKDVTLAFPAYDLMRKIKYKKFPSRLEKIKHLSKVFLYSIVSKNKYSLKFYLLIISNFKRIIRREV